MKLIRDIIYAPELGERGRGDLFLPDDFTPSNAIPSALVIHGGGWNAMEKSSLHPLAKILAERGYVSFCPNYRLLKHAPWPACGNDCLKAADFLEKAIATLYPGFTAAPMIVTGMSAGGHLALTTGLQLPPEKVKCIISLAGPSELKKQFNLKYFQMGPDYFFGKEKITERDYKYASPVSMIKKSSPPIYCLHSTKDELVPPIHADLMVEQALKLGVKAEKFFFEGNDHYHGMWADWTANGFREEGKDLSQRIFLEPIQKELKRILDSI